MQKISRAGDNLWVVSAFDPRKPVDPDWATRDPAPVLRSGDEDRIFRDAPHPHDHFGDSMREVPRGPRDEDYEDPNSQWYDPYTDPDYHEEPEYETNYNVSPEVPASDLFALREHSIRAGQGGGSVEGSQGHYVEYHPTSSVNHYYTYNPRNTEDWEPWNLVSTHWALRDPIQTRHRTFNEAAGQANTNRSIMDRQVG